LNNLSILLSGLLMASLTSEVDANDADKIEFTEIEGEITEIEGFTETQSDGSAILSNLELFHNQGEIDAKGSFLLNGVESELEFEGLLYPFGGKGFRDDDVIGDIEIMDENYNILQFLIENEGKILTILVEDVKNQSWFKFEEELDNSLFDNILKGAEVSLEANSLNDREQFEKVAPLYNVNNNSDIISEESETDTLEQSYNANTDKEIDIQSRDISVQNVSEVGVALNELKITGSANLDDYSIPNSVFRNSGWSYDSSIADYSDGGGTYHSYSTTQVGSTITQISFMDTGAYFQGFTSSGVNRFDVTTTLADSLMVELDHNTNELSILYYGGGVDIRDFENGMFALTGENVFRNQTLNGSNVSESGNGAVSFLVGLVPHGSTITDLVDIIGDNGSDNLGNTIGFTHSTFEDQRRNLDGRVYRGIRAVASNHTLSSEGANLTFQGEIHSPDHDITLDYSIKHVARHNL